MDSTSGSSSQAPKLIREESPSTPPQVHLQEDGKQPEASDMPGEIKIQSNEEVREKDKKIEHLINVNNDLVFENSRLKIEVAKYRRILEITYVKNRQNKAMEEADREVLRVGEPSKGSKNVNIHIIVNPSGNVVDAIMTDSDEDSDEDLDSDEYSDDGLDSDEDSQEQREEAMRLPLEEEIGSSSKMGSSQTVLPSDPTTDGSEIVKQSGSETKIIQRKRKLDVRWATDTDMVCSLSDNSEMLLEAICALYRQENIMRQRSQSSQGMIRIGDSDFETLERVAQFLMQGNVCSPNTKTKEELENHIKGAVEFCSQLVHNYSKQLYDIYIRGMDNYFC